MTKAAARWEHASAWPLTILAVLFLGAYAWPILDPTLPAWGARTAHALTWLTWAAFAADYALRWYWAPNRVAFVWRNLFGLLVILLPVLRPLRLLLLVTVLNVLHRHAGVSLRGQVAVYVSSAVGVLLLVASLAAFDAERNHPDANITTFPDAIWWAIATVTTVGYGDRYPVTDQGRVISTALMLAGIALLGVITASFAAWMVERVQENEEESQAATRADVAALSAQVAALSAQVAAAACACQAAPPRPGSPPDPTATTQ